MDVTMRKRKSEFESCQHLGEIIPCNDCWQQCWRRMTETKEKQETNTTGLGFDLYPDRRSGRPEPNWWERLTRSQVTDYYKLKCELNIQKVIKNNPVIKILLGALKNAGCPVDLKRHIVCEECSSSVVGGYDSEYNQIVICKNISKSRNNPEAILMHELIHMYDYCVNNLDFKNLDHLACTEIRAASLCHCSFLSSFFLGQSSFLNAKQTHKDCVKYRAAYSLKIARGLDFKTALNHVLKVFDRCYNDLEPIGRRSRRNSSEPYMAYEEAKCYNITDL